MDKNIDTTTDDLENKCAACDKIADSGGMKVEAEDYILHFCGEECYAYWRKKHKETIESKDVPMNNKK